MQIKNKNKKQVTVKSRDNFGTAPRKAFNFIQSFTICESTQIIHLTDVEYFLMNENVNI